MRKFIKIGFPIVCVAIIGGTFILLNKTTEKINRNKLKDDVVQENVVNNSSVEDEDEEVEKKEIISNTVVNSDKAKKQEIENKSKAIEIVKAKAPSVSNCYYTNEGMEDKKYIVAIKNSDTQEVIIYYSVDIQSEKIEIYEK